MCFNACMTVIRNRRAQGALGEARARTVLESKGFRFVTGNYYCRWGEIDLIMRDGPALVFIEVRSRRSARYGSPLESVTRTKQARLVKAARHYLMRFPHDGPLRFDVVGLSMSDEGEVQHLENAIDAGAYV